MHNSTNVKFTFYLTYDTMGRKKYRKEIWCRILKLSNGKWRMRVKRETGARPVRTRHCDQGAGCILKSLGNREGIQQSDDLEVRKPAIFLYGKRFGMFSGHE